MKIGIVITFVLGVVFGLIVASVMVASDEKDDLYIRLEKCDKLNCDFNHASICHLKERLKNTKLCEKHEIEV